MDVSCPSLPPKILVADKVRPNAQTTKYMPARGCHFVECSLSVLLVIIEVFFLTMRDTTIARTVFYKVSIATVSRTFWKNNLRILGPLASIAIVLVKLPAAHLAISPFQLAWVAFRRLSSAKAWRLDGENV